MRIPTSFRGQLTCFITMAVGGWIGFLLVFQHFFPNDYDPSDSRAVFWTWLTGGTVFFLAFEVGAFHFLRTPPSWRSAMAIAGIAPALILDSIATTYYVSWFDTSGQYESAAYSATILGGAGVMLLGALVQQRDSVVRPRDNL